MSISPIFTFAPIPLTQEISPLAHAAAVRRRIAESGILPVIERRTRATRKATEPVLN